MTLLEVNGGEIIVKQKVHDTGIMQYSTVGPRFELCLTVDSFEVQQTNVP